MDPLNVVAIKTSQFPTSDVRLDEHFLLYFAKTPMSVSIKEILNKTGIDVVFSEGKYLHKTITQDLSQENSHTAATHLILDIISAKNNFRVFYYKLSDLLSEVSTQGIFNYDKTSTYIQNEMYPLIKKNPIAYTMISDIIAKEDDDLYFHYILKNLIFTIAVMELDKEKIFSNIYQKIAIALSALLLDIGILAIMHQLNISNKKIEIALKDKKTIVLISKMNQTIFRKSKVSPQVSDIIVNTEKIHIDFNIANSINISSRYLYLISTYVYLTSPLPHKKEILPYQAIQFLSQKNNQVMFDKLCLKSLLGAIGPFPPGTYVELKNSICALVVSPEETDILNPWVCLLENAEHSTPDEINVISSDSQRFSIKRILDPAESVLYKQKYITLLQSRSMFNNRTL